MKGWNQQEHDANKNHARLVKEESESKHASNMLRDGLAGQILDALEGRWSNLEEAGFDEDAALMLIEQVIQKYKPHGNVVSVETYQEICKELYSAKKSIIHYQQQILESERFEAVCMCGEKARHHASQSINHSFSENREPCPFEITLRRLLTSSVVMKSNEDDVTLNVNADAYNASYEALLSVNPSDGVHADDCGYTITGKECNCSCENGVHNTPHPKTCACKKCRQDREILKGYEMQREENSPYLPHED